MEAKLLSVITALKGIRKSTKLKNTIFISIISLLLIFPGIFYKTYTADPLTSIIKHAGLCFLFLLPPMVLFYRNIKIYFYLLAVFATFVPMICFAIYFFGLHDMSIITTLIFQTNLHEVIELGRGLGFPFLLITILYMALYLFCVNKTTLKRIPFITTLILSLFSFAIVWKKIAAKAKGSEEPYVMVLDQYYPVSLVSSFVNILNNPFEPKEVNSFSFNAHMTHAMNKRQIYVFIIGESSQYYHWQINGYARATSPKIVELKNLISFPNVAAGAHYTMLSVPQMITRAYPGNMNVQYKEKSILSAFREAGFKTAWLSNQYPNYWVSTIVPHAITADICIFPDGKQLNKSNSYDGCFLPLIDSIIRSTDQNLFIVFHTMGSHWDYSQRYPKSFDYFKPSGKDVSIIQFTKGEHQAIINSYDNSIRYSDFIIDSTIRMINKYNALSYVIFLADHGEDVYDSDSTQWYSHDKASIYTLHVPLFIWTSDQYNKAYPLKRNALLINQNKKIGENDVFYTLLDMAGITYPEFDSTKSIASKSFKDDPQEYIEPDDKKTYFYSNLPH